MSRTDMTAHTDNARKRRDRIVLTVLLSLMFFAAIFVTVSTNSIKSGMERHEIQMAADYGVDKVDVRLGKASLPLVTNDGVTQECELGGDLPNNMPEKLCGIYPYVGD